MAFEIEVKKNVFGYTTFYIDENEVRFDGKRILIGQISGFGYYSIRETNGLLNKGRIFVLFIYEIGVKIPHKLICTYAIDGTAAEGKFREMHKYLWLYIGERARKILHEALLKAEELELDRGLRVNAKGAYTTKPGLLKLGPETFTEWNDMEMEIPKDDLIVVGQDDLVVKQKSTGKTVGIHHLGRKNIRLLQYYHSWLNENPDEMRSLEKVIRI